MATEKEVNCAVFTWHKSEARKFDDSNNLLFPYFKLP